MAIQVAEWIVVQIASYGSWYGLTRQSQSLGHWRHAAIRAWAGDADSW